MFNTRQPILETVPLWTVPGLLAWKCTQLNTCITDLSCMANCCCLFHHNMQSYDDNCLLYDRWNSVRQAGLTHILTGWGNGPPTLANVVGPFVSPILFSTCRITGPYFLSCSCSCLWSGGSVSLCAIALVPSKHTPTRPGTIGLSQTHPVVIQSRLKSRLNPHPTSVPLLQPSLAVNLRRAIAAPYAAAAVAVWTAVTTQTAFAPAVSAAASDSVGDVPSATEKFSAMAQRWGGCGLWRTITLSSFITYQLGQSKSVTPLANLDPAVMIGVSNCYSFPMPIGLSNLFKVIYAIMWVHHVITMRPWWPFSCHAAPCWNRNVAARSVDPSHTVSASTTCARLKLPKPQSWAMSSSGNVAAPEAATDAVLPAEGGTSLGSASWHTSTKQVRGLVLNIPTASMWKWEKLALARIMWDGRSQGRKGVIPPCSQNNTFIA